MNRILEFRPEARQDFDEAADWYEEQRQGLREEFIYAVDATLARIKSSPLAFPIVTRLMVRRAVVDRFSLFNHFFFFRGINTRLRRFPQQPQSTDLARTSRLISLLH